MKTVYLLRHAKSSWGDMTVDDHDRPLNERGRTAGALVAHYLKNNGLIADLFICSTAARARQTLQCLQTVLGDDIKVRFDGELYMASSKKMLKVINHADDSASSVMLIGHNPGMHMLAVAMTAAMTAAGDGDSWERLHTKYPTAALAVLTSAADQWRDVNECRLESFVCPRDLE